MPFDGSAAAERVLRRACRAARAGDAHLTVLCVVILPANISPEEAPVELDETALRALTRAQEVCREEDVAAAFQLSHARNPADVIVEEARRSGAAVICLGLEPHAPGEAAPMSPTAQAVLATAPCSVLLDDPETELPPAPSSGRNGRPGRGRAVDVPAPVIVIRLGRRTGGQG